MAGRKLIERAEREPRLVAVLFLSSDGRKQIAHDRHREDRSHDPIEEQADLHEQRASRLLGVRRLGVRLMETLRCGPALGPDRADLASGAAALPARPRRR